MLCHPAWAVGSYSSSPSAAKIVETNSTGFHHFSVSPCTRELMVLNRVMQGSQDSDRNVPLSGGSCPAPSCRGTTGRSCGWTGSTGARTAPSSSARSATPSARARRRRPSTSSVSGASWVICCSDIALNWDTSNKVVHVEEGCGDRPRGRLRHCYVALELTGSY